MTTKTDIKLLPCPFCGGEAEMDTRQGYLALGTGRLGNRIAVYCQHCNADMGVCIEDVPDITPEQVAEMWNRRAVEVDRQGRMPSDDDILEVWSGDPTHSRPIMGKGKVITFARALLSRYGSSQPAVCEGKNCGATDGAPHSPECILEAAEAQGWADSPEADEARRQIAARPAAGPAGSPADAIGFQSFSPDDRFYHAADSTWWRRGDDGMLTRAEAPQTAASTEPRPDEYAYFADWYGKDAPDENEVGNFDMARHAWLAGIRFADLFTAAVPVAQEPVAWMHNDPKRYDVIHAQVKQLLVDSHKAASYLTRSLDNSEHYTVPLYAAPVAAQAQPSVPDVLETGAESTDHP